ncbi:hypothetical protein [Leucobacter luti]|uniref:Uncharacterized protein n=1 Tax=Leucobacter luti TaxID=340320 RepID=A0A4Q7TY59_9MICO|nr:hypothetical protein [Leucobacter luti]MBL3698588.1 hypothetical protein [Leucobacter luti]RZT65963.1 hypothetical protein EV139_1387 [Leucobacter luti]
MITRTSTVRFWAPAAIAVAALTLTGCSGGDGGTGTPSLEDGPLSKYMTALWDGQEMTQEQFDKQNLETEEFVAACMAKEGFEYTPNTQNAGQVYNTEDMDGPEMGTEEFAKEYGYGIVNSPWIEQGMGGTEEEYVDPNQDYVNSLSESEQTAYYETLSGPSLSEEEWAEIEASEGGYSPDLSEQGCYGAAQLAQQEKSGNDMEMYEDPEFTDLFDSMNDVWTELYDEENPNPEMTKIDQSWAACMEESGYPDFTSPMAAQNVMYDEYNALGMPDGDEGEYREPSKEDSDAFAKREIEVATADFACQTKTKYQEKQMKVQFALEQKFVDQHQAELDALLSKYSAKKKD